jgi:Uma2 family endonuclease
MVEFDEDFSMAGDPSANYGMSYTYADYLKFEYQEMVEIIRGKLFKMSPAPKVNHQKVSINILRNLLTFFENTSCTVFHAPTDVILPIKNKTKLQSNTVVQPDIFVVCNQDIIEDAGIFGAPDLIIEILSPHSKKKDLQLKYEVYEEALVKEYWIAMPEEKLVEVFSLKSGKFQRIQTYVDSDEMSSVLFQKLCIDLNSVFQGIKD